MACLSGRFRKPWPNFSCGSPPQRLVKKTPRRLPLAGRLHVSAMREPKCLCIGETEMLTMRRLPAPGFGYTFISALTVEHAYQPRSVNLTVRIQRHSISQIERSWSLITWQNFATITQHPIGI